ncbi:MAG TPA: S41 family peptidase [Terriglobales bacterium]|nr:S41 family peptidase [Terriglobales bacterium]
MAKNKGSQLLFVLIVLFFLAVSVMAQERSAPEAERTAIDLQSRVMIASRIYSSIQMYFGHWKGVPSFDLEKEYANYIQQVLVSDNRRDFDLASMEFVAALQNGHSAFGDQWLRDNFGQMIGFYARPIDGEWVITQTSLADLPLGEVLTAIDNEPFDAFYRRNRKYISASNERWRQHSLFEYTYLFPPSFVVTLKNGKKVSVTRKGAFQWSGQQFKTIETRQQDGVAIVRIPIFAPATFEDSAVEFIKNLGQVKALILDVRGNHGGSTPANLVDGLMDRPYRWMSQTTAANIAVLRAWEISGQHAELSFGSDPQQPKKTLYSGPLYILTDGGCYSACEDLVAPFKDNHRAVIVGERTGGSTGQPYGQNFGNGMRVSLSTLREYLPDGTPFEGIGIAPDIEVRTSAADLQKGNDPVLAKALEVIGQTLDKK